MTPADGCSAYTHASIQGIEECLKPYLRNSELFICNCILLASIWEFVLFGCPLGGGGPWRGDKGVRDETRVTALGVRVYQRMRVDQLHTRAT